MKPPLADKPYISNTDTVVAFYGGGFPRNRNIRCKICCDQTNSMLTIEHGRDQSETSPCETVVFPRVGGRHVIVVSKAYSSYISHADWVLDSMGKVEGEADSSSRKHPYVRGGGVRSAGANADEGHRFLL
jgi:hypothetical protein